MKKKSFISFSLILALALIVNPVKINAETEGSYTNGTYLTPYSASLPISRYNGNIAYMCYPDKDTLYPLAQLKESASNLYNCFTYAFIYCGNTTGLSEMNSSETFFLNSPSYLFGSQNPCYEHIDFDDIREGDIAIYRVDVNYQYTQYGNYIHAGIVLQKGTSFENTVIISKWGEYSIYSHKINYCPYTYSGVSLAAPIPTPIQIPVDISFARLTHSYGYYNYAADGPDTIQSDTYHKLRCIGCGAFHFEEHDKDIDIIIMKVGSLSYSTHHEITCDCGYYLSEAHTYDANGECNVCGYSPIMLNNIEEVEDQ